jgi:hypothetical protein
VLTKAVSVIAPDFVRSTRDRKIEALQQFRDNNNIYTPSKQQFAWSLLVNPQSFKKVKPELELTSWQETFIGNRQKICDALIKSVRKAPRNSGTTIFIRNRVYIGDAAWKDAFLNFTNDDKGLCGICKVHQPTIRRSEPSRFAEDCFYCERGTDRGKAHIKVLCLKSLEAIAATFGPASVCSVSDRGTSSLLCVYAQLVADCQVTSRNHQYILLSGTYIIVICALDNGELRAAAATLQKLPCCQRTAEWYVSRSGTISKILLMKAFRSLCCRVLTGPSFQDPGRFLIVFPSELMAISPFRNVTGVFTVRGRKYENMNKLTHRATRTYMMPAHSSISSAWWKSASLAL